jgi:peptide deformylase
VTPAIRQLAESMLDTMYAAKGLGLAAEQIGREESICVIDVPPSYDTLGTEGTRANPDVKMPLVMINPRIVKSEGSQSGQEGCLSFPEIYATIRRAMDVDVEFMDLQGNRQTVHARALVARAVQHELDHLDGVLLADRMSAVQRLAVSGKLKRLRQETKAKAAVL